jgi:hypothetical protein
MKKSQLLKFGWDDAGLAERINDDSTDILRKQVFTGSTIDLVNIQEGVKHKELIKQFDVDVTWQDGSACGFDASGDAVLTDREIEVKSVKLNLEFCNLDLIETWGNKLLAAGSINELEDMPLEQILIQHLNEKNSLALNTAVWQGDETNGIGNNGFFDGFELLFDTESANMIDINTNGATTFTSTNAYDIMYDAYVDYQSDDTGLAVLENSQAVAMLTRAQFGALVKNISDENNFHFNATDAQKDGEFILPNTDLLVKRFGERADNTKFYIGRPEDMVVGTDLRSDFDTVKVWYDETDEVIRVKIRFKAGVQVTFPEQFGYFELAAS